MGPLLEIVSHVWQYERCLTYHLSALLLQPPATCRVVATVFYAAADFPVVNVLDFFHKQPLPPQVAWNFRPLSPERLCRRAIGRNLACLETKADFVLLSDVDYLFCDNSLDLAAAKLAAVCADGPKLCFPRYIQSSIDHAAGEAELARAEFPAVLTIDRSRYDSEKLSVAIGGAQWIPGDWARERGYLRDSRRFQRPASQWRRTFCDRAFRGWSGLPLCRLELEGIYRIRHEKRGRFDVGCRN